MGLLVFGALTASLLLLAGPAPEQKVTPYASHDVLPKDSPDKMVCKKEETVGSRLGAKKVCLTKEEWQQVADQGREHTEKIQESVCVPGAGCL